MNCFQRMGFSVSLFKSSELVFFQLVVRKCTFVLGNPPTYERKVVTCSKILFSYAVDVYLEKCWCSRFQPSPRACTLILTVLKLPLLRNNADRWGDFANMPYGLPHQNSVQSCAPSSSEDSVCSSALMNESIAQDSFGSPCTSSCTGPLMGQLPRVQLESDAPI